MIPEIILNNVGKRFRYEWIFKNMNVRFDGNNRYAVLGANGAGKSTLMKILSGHLSPTQGEVAFYNQNKKIAGDSVYKTISYAAPYIDLIEEYSLVELIAFHARFKPFIRNFSAGEIIDILDLGHTADKEIRFFSSGMKQRVRVGLAVLSDTPVLLLDEPTTNLDVKGIDWYKTLLEKYAPPIQRLTIVASNTPHDYAFCNEFFNVETFK